MDAHRLQGAAVPEEIAFKDADVADPYRRIRGPGCVLPERMKDAIGVKESTGLGMVASNLGT